MQFTSSNAFIASIIALLSLMAPVVSAATANIITPIAGQNIQAASDSVQVTWTVDPSAVQALTGVLCNITLTQTTGGATTQPGAQVIVQSSVSIMSQQSTVSLAIQNIIGSSSSVFQLVSLDGQTVFGQSSTFTIA